ncbi:iron-containing alcohol dehydrogenase [Parabacteroides pacaensis]|uniref:iron-containing alcohol dehydrogenase n=1 Tax=Parabacteroides pacaensis TaxID=2086575 RepID=UPI000D10A475|nr:iron-containing alcohol dehydrogenase [Parabacteroides pacaensis]
MLEQVITSTKIIVTPHLSAEEMERLIFYCKGEEANPCVIMDNHPLDARDAMLNEWQKIRPVEILNNVFPNPKVEDIMDMANTLQDKKINVVIGIGGGSSLDSAKGVAVILSNGGDLEEYLGATPSKKIEQHNVQLILIPTTAGTGSEVTKVGVYTSRSGRKYTLGHPCMQADIAVLVTEYVKNLPPALTASTAFDALSHALETLWNRNATPLTDKIATESAVYLLKNMEAAYESSLSGKETGRTEMLQGACMAGIGFNITGTAAVHALSFIFSEEWDIPHGIACAFTLEDVFRLNLRDEKTRVRLVEVAKRLFDKENEDDLLSSLLNRIISLKKKFGLPFSFRDLNIELPETKIGELFNKSLEDPKMKNNSTEITSRIIFDLIKSKINKNIESCR